jgi:hypothetical protein
MLNRFRIVIKGLKKWENKALLESLREAIEGLTLDDFILHKRGKERKISE